MGKDPAEILGIDVMFSIIKDSKSMSRVILEEKYLKRVGQSKIRYLKRYLDRIYS